MIQSIMGGRFFVGFLRNANVWKIHVFKRDAFELLPMAKTQTARGPIPSLTVKTPGGESTSRRVQSLSADP